MKRQLLLLAGLISIAWLLVPGLAFSRSTTSFHSQRMRKGSALSHHHREAATFVISSDVSETTSSHQVMQSQLQSRRRCMLKMGSLLLTLAAGDFPAKAQALDMDAFANGELSTTKDNEPKKKLSDDAALCKFGQPSKERGDACIRAGMPTTLKKGGVDAYGNVNRGQFQRCQQLYVEDPDNPKSGFLVKKTVCE